MYTDNCTSLTFRQMHYNSLCACSFDVYLCLAISKCMRLATTLAKADSTPTVHYVLLIYQEYYIMYSHIYIPRKTGDNTLTVTSHSV